MKKFFARVFCSALIFVLLFSVPLKAASLYDWADFPDTFDFEMEFELEFRFNNDFIFPHETERFHSYNVSMNGTVVEEELTASVYMEIDLGIKQIILAEVPEIEPLMEILGIDLSEPFRIWLELDVNDLDDSVNVMVVEMPAFMQVYLLMEHPEMAMQYWVLDLSEFIAEIADELDAEIHELSEAELEEIMLLFEEVYDELMVLLESFFDEFTFEFNETDDAITVFLNIASSSDSGFSSTEFTFTFNAEITNMGTAQRVPLPELTDENSLDIIEWAETNGFDLSIF